MSTYRNGEVPASALVTIASGTNGDGYWEHQLTPATLSKHNRLVQLGIERRGRRLQITAGWNAYRPLEPQWIAYRNSPPGYAAYPSTSSHGGEYQGRDAMAMDYGNWAYVWGTQDAFYAACREVGLVPGIFSWEPWHVIDYAPFAAVAGGSTNYLLEDDMPDMNEFLNTPAYTGGPTISEFFKAVDQGGIATQVWARTVDRGLDEQGRPVHISALQELADAKSLIMQMLGRPVGDVTVDVDEAAIVTGLAPLITEHLAQFPDDLIARLATATADEQDRRELARRQQQV